MADPRCIWREGVRQPLDANIYRALFDVRREAPADEVCAIASLHLKYAA